MDSTEAEFSHNDMKDLPRRRERSHPCARQEVGDWPNGRGTEPQDRLGSLPCPLKRPLLSVAKITKAGKQVYWGEDKAFVKNNKTGQITNLRRERNVWMLDLWAKRRVDAMDVSSFQRLGR